jgi:hypothetical protein
MDIFKLSICTSCEARVTKMKTAKKMTADASMTLLKLCLYSCAPYSIIFFSILAVFYERYRSTF